MAAPELELWLEVTPSRGAIAEDFVACGRVRNRGAKPVTLNLSVLLPASLALEIRGGDGTPVRMPPPPVPGRTPEMRTISSGESLSVDWPAFLPEWTAPGRYEVRFRCLGAAQHPTKPAEPSGSVVVSTWAAFELAARG